MINYLIEFLQTHIVPLGSLGIFLGSVLEEVVAPIPSAAVLFTAGVLYLKGLSGLSFFVKLIFYIAMPAAAGIAIGSLLVYWLGYYSGKPFIVRWGKWFGLGWGDIEKIEKKFEQGPGDEIFLFVSRAIPSIPNVAISAFAGLVRIPLKTFLIWGFLGAVVRSALLAYIGFALGGVYSRFFDDMSVIQALLILFALGFVVLMLLFVYKRKQG